MNDSPKNEQRPLTTTISVDQTPEQAFEATNDLRGWWSGDIEGPTDVLEGEFSYRYEDFHFSKQQVTELVPGKKLVWQIVDSYLGFVANEREWNGTKVIFPDPMAQQMGALWRQNPKAYDRAFASF